MGHYLAKHWFAPGGNTRALWTSFMAPFLVHGAYDAPLLITWQARELGLKPNAYGGTLLSYIVVIVASVWALTLVGAARKSQDQSALIDEPR